MKYRIIQIIPNNKDIYSCYQENNGGITSLEIICFALIEWEDGEREVKPMDITTDGVIGFLDESVNFLNIE
ncbi:hypothetical protein [Tissierella creatinophila]|uniref:Uncharacterized protein n=1 Tax=Tissierella creatinophila DSM 6911 TaxID=1123403 RepID=A0A1U7M6R2_TISCR|nr:hypothetical protein [Tissierella creatinophila]OLS02899.1 hypothetical protein TICRE_10530 [Tissierella creatinophila DSM 6911]